MASTAATTSVSPCRQITSQTAILAKLRLMTEGVPEAIILPRLMMATCELNSSASDM